MICQHGPPATARIKSKIMTNKEMFGSVVCNCENCTRTFINLYLVNIRLWRHICHSECVQNFCGGELSTLDMIMTRNKRKAIINYVPSWNPGDRGMSRHHCMNDHGGRGYGGTKERCHLQLVLAHQPGKVNPTVRSMKSAKTSASHQLVFRRFGRLVQKQSPNAGRLYLAGRGKLLMWVSPTEEYIKMIEYKTD